MPVTGEVVAIGDELLSGDVIDTNSSHVSRELFSIGIEVKYRQVVGDDIDSIKKALDLAAERSQVCVVCGGLGPTEDDMTTKAAAESLGVDLQLDEGVLASLKERFEKLGIAWTESNVKQAMFPVGSEILPNKWGSAAGFMIKNGSSYQFFLPGVPAELEKMMANVVIPRIIKYFGRGETFLKRSLKFFGVTESKLNTLLADLSWSSDSYRISSLPHFPEVEIKIIAWGGSPEEVERILNNVENMIRERAGSYIYGTDSQTLEERVGALLRERKMTLAVAESCTGGLIGDMITKVPGSSDYFERGLVTYSNRAKIELLGVPEEVLRRHGAVSESTARAMAKGVRERSRTSIGLATTGIAGPTGGSPEKPVGTVFIAVTDGDKTICKRYQFGGDRLRIKALTASVALENLRRFLLSQEMIEYWGK